MVGRLFNPLVGLLLLVVLYTANSASSAYYGEQTSGESDVIYALGFSLFLTWWVYLDRRKRRYSAAFEFEAFVFFAWIVVVPVYLIQTRRWRGVPLIGCLYGAVLLPYLASLALYDG